MSAQGMAETVAWTSLYSAMVQDGLSPPFQPGPAVTKVIRELVTEALTARSPATMEDATEAGDGTLHGAVDHWQERALRAEAELAARQPVGVEPIAEVSRETFSSDGTSDIIKPNLPIGTKLYASPPAPAAVPVDAIEAARSAYKALKVYSTGKPARAR